MPGVGVDELAGRRIVDPVDASHQLGGSKLTDHRVEQFEDLCRGQVQARVGAHGGSELTHYARGVDPAPGDIADHQSRASGPELDGLVPVAAHAGAGDARLVVRRDLQMI